MRVPSETPLSFHRFLNVNPTLQRFVRPFFFGPGIELRIALVS
jgi:hypothetical protein